MTRRGQVCSMQLALGTWWRWYDCSLETQNTTQAHVKLQWHQKKSFSGLILASHTVLSSLLIDLLSSIFFLFFSPACRVRPCVSFGRWAKHSKSVTSWVCSTHSKMRMDKRASKRTAMAPLFQVNKHPHLMHSQPVAEQNLLTYLPLWGSTQINKWGVETETSPLVPLMCEIGFCSKSHKLVIPSIVFGFGLESNIEKANEEIFQI